MLDKQTVFDESLRTLRKILIKTYDEDVQAGILINWEKSLSKENPSWKYIGFDSHKVSSGNDLGHVFSMVDTRMPDIGFVGYFAATSEGAGVQVLDQACDSLKRRGIKEIYGPIDGTIINNYRLNEGPSSLFPGEPINPEFYIECFNIAGFDTYNTYQTGSSSLKNMKFLQLFMKPPTDKFPQISMRNFDQSKFSEELSTLADLVNAIFPSQSEYGTAYAKDEFFYIFGQQKEIFDSRYCIFLEDNGTAIGAIFCYKYNDSLIVKTIGVIKQYQGTGISKLLIKEVHKRAREDGLKTAIYALVRNGNRVSKMKRPGVKIIRQYVTMKKEV